MNSNKLRNTSLPPKEGGDHVLPKSYWNLHTELIQLSKTFGFPKATYSRIAELVEALNSNKQMARKPMQEINQTDNLPHSENINLIPNTNNGKRSLDRYRLNISKLKIPARTPVVFGPFSLEQTPISQVLDFLYLGNSRDAINFEKLKKLGITHIINATQDLPNYFEGNGEITYLRVGVEDSGTASLMPHFSPAIEFIDDAVRSKGRVLVHCHEGVSRSASLVVAYILAHSNLSLMNALAVVSHARPNICPNTNFIGQLDKFKQTLQRGSKSNVQSYPCINQNVEQMITKRFQDYLPDASKDDPKPTRLQKCPRRDPSRTC